MIGCARQSNDIDSHELASYVITEEQAVRIALEAASKPAPEVSAIENPKLVRTELMRVGQFASVTGESLGVARSQGDGLWIVQLEGKSRSLFPGGPGTEFAYAAMILDAETGDVIGQRRGNEPLLE